MGLTEWEEQRKLMERNEIKNCLTLFTIPIFYIRYKFTRNGIEWTAISQKSSNLLVQLAQLILINQSQLDALATLANIVHLNIDNFYYFS